MDISYLLHGCRPTSEKEAGFENGKLEILLSCRMTAVFTLAFPDFSVEVYDDGEKYMLFDVPAADGAFVSEMRKEVLEKAEAAVKKLYSGGNPVEKLLLYAKEKYGTEPDNPFSGDGGSAVLRTPKGKWYGLIMRIKYRNLGIPSDGEISVINLKHPPEKMGETVDNKAVFPAYHMNKKYWITVILSSDVPFEKITALLDESYAEVNGTCRALRKDVPRESGLLDKKKKR